MAASFAGSGAIQILNVVTGVVLARSLGPADRGSLAAVLLWPTVVSSLGQLCVPEAATYAVARRARDDADIVGTAAFLALLQAIVCLLVTAGTLLFVFRGAPTAVREAAFACLAVVPLYVLTGYLAALLQGLQSYGAFNATRILVSLATAIFLVGLAAAGEVRLWTVVLAYVGTYAVCAACALAFLPRRLIQKPVFDAMLARELLAYGLRSTPHFVATTLNERLDQLMMTILLPAASLGLYVVGVTLASGVGLIGASVALVAMPALAAASGEERVGLARRYAGIATGLAALASVLGIATAPWLIQLLFGMAFLPVVGVSRLLLVAAVLLTSTRLLASMLKGLGLPGRTIMPELVALAATVLGLSLFLPTLKLWGAAITSLVVYAVSAVWMSQRLADALEIPVRRLWLPDRADRMGGETHG